MKERAELLDMKKPKHASESKFGTRKPTIADDCYPGFDDVLYRLRLLTNHDFSSAIFVLALTGAGSLDVSPDVLRHQEVAVGALQSRSILQSPVCSVELLQAEIHRVAVILHPELKYHFSMTFRQSSRESFPEALQLVIIIAEQEVFQPDAGGRRVSEVEVVKEFVELRMLMLFPRLIVSRLLVSVDWGLRDGVTQGLLLFDVVGEVAQGLGKGSELRERDC